MVTDWHSRVDFGRFLSYISCRFPHLTIGKILRNIGIVEYT
jgi:hypothetical protein